MDRAKTLALIDVARSRGLEIGAQTRPVVTRDMGPVEYVDRASTEELRRWYAIDPNVDAAELVEVDHCWGDRTLLDCVGRRVDYVVASHVLEHVPDLLGWLREIADVLVEGGIASFVIPDKRFTFDILRRPSSPAELVDAYLRRERRPSPRQIFDHFHGFRDIGSEPIRTGRMAPADVPPIHSLRELIEICRRALETPHYIDAHCWVFTPQSFVAVLDFANESGLLPFEIAALFPTAENTDEFFVSLRRLPDGSEEQHRVAFLASRARLDLPFEEDPEARRAREKLEAMAASEAAARADLARVEQAGREAADRAEQAERQLDAMRRSTSWRLTQPLRRLASGLRVLRRRRP